jgi:hypothetical protein
VQQRPPCAEAPGALEKVTKAAAALELLTQEGEGGAIMERRDLGASKG